MAVLRLIPRVRVQSLRYFVSPQSSASQNTRRSSSYQPPSAPPPASEPGNPHRSFYRLFGRPIAKVFLGALLTYQLTYWTWMKLETMEVTAQKS
ncbi:hypothetical protein LTR16_006424, partial [Cryomyces antarcticus]